MVNGRNIERQISYIFGMVIGETSQYSQVSIKQGKGFISKNAQFAGKQVYYDIPWLRWEFLNGIFEYAQE